ncbi:MAG: autotransporter domain-containing protein [Chromatiaceae bacterium]|nr:autotransporter domain-containing protein [Chromatiaceae bacterium]
MNSLRSIGAVRHRVALLILLMFCSAIASAATNITSLTSNPTTVASGQQVIHSITVTTDAVEVLSGSATLTLLRDGVQVQQVVDQGFLDRQDIATGVFQDQFTLDPLLYSEPGNYQLQVLIEGTEDFSTPVSDLATTSFTVAGPTAVSPTSLNLSAAPGTTASGTFMVTDGLGPFSLSAAQGELSQLSAVVGDTITYSHAIAASVAPGTQLSDTITVTPSAGSPVTIPVTINVTAPTAITTSPTSLSLTGQAGETPTTTFAVTSGIGPFLLESANTEGRGSFSNTTPALNEVVTYGFRIPGAATDQQVITDTITVTGSDGAQLVLLATITVGTSTSPIEGVLQSIATTPPQVATAAAIEIICPSGVAEPQLQADCDAVVGGALSADGSLLQAQAAEALAQVTTDQATASLDASQLNMRGQIRNLGARIVALRGGVGGFSARGLTFNFDGQSIAAGDIADAMLRELNSANGGGASSDGGVDFGRWGVFVNGTVGSGDRDETDNVAGYEFDTVSLTVGADYRYNDNLIAGVAVGYSNNDTDLDANGGGVEADSYNLSLYGTYFDEAGLYVDGMLSYGRSNFDQKRNIRYTIGSVNVDQTAKADFDGTEWSASLGGGYSFSRGPLTFGPTVRLEYIKTDVDAFDEKMSDPNAAGGGWATHIESQDLSSFTSQIGGEVSYAISTNWGVLLPNAQLQWVHEFEDNSGNVVGHYLQDTSSTSFSLPVDDLDQNYFNMTLGVSAQFAQGRSAFIYYRQLLGYDDLDAYTVGGGLRLEF